MFFFRKRSRPLPIQAEGKQSQTGVCFAGSVVSDIGCLRPNNEDNYVLDRYMNDNSDACSEVAVSVTDRTDQWHFAAVFDGMGGGDRGEAAAAAAARIFLEAAAGLSTDASKQNVDLVMRNAFLEANNAIVAMQQEYNVYGTTGTVCSMNGEVFKIYHLGDSRAYLFREGHLFQLTRDQTLAQMKMDAGIYDEDAPQAEADRHRLTEYIGRDRTKENICPVESEWIAMEQTDRVLLCSDGLYDMCPDLEIEQIMQKFTEPDRQTRALTDAARAAGGRDNITCIVAASLR